MTQNPLTCPNTLPSAWRFTPVGNPKRKRQIDGWQKIPYLPGWQTNPVPIETIMRYLSQGACTGLGLLTGEISGGLLAIDIDGAEPLAHFLQLCGGSLPKSVSWTSGLRDRQQILFQVPQDYWPQLAKLNRKALEFCCGNQKQQLDFRWNNSQSVLPPSAHPSTGRYQWIHSPLGCEVACAPAWLLEYLGNLMQGPPPITGSFAELVPACQQTIFSKGDLPMAYSMPDNGRDEPRGEALKAVCHSLTPQKNTRLSQPPLEVPLEICLTRSDRQLILEGSLQGSRNSSGAKLARNLLGTAHFLDWLGRRYQGSPRLLFDQFCDRCTPVICAREADTIWKSAQKTDPTPSLSTDAIETCIKTWEQKQALASLRNGSRSSSTARGRSSACLGEATVHPQERSDFHLPVNVDTPSQSVNVAEPLRCREAGNLDKFDIDPEVIHTIADVRTKRAGSLDLDHFLHPELALPLKQVAAAKPTSPEMLLTTGLAVWSSLVGTAAEVEIKGGYDPWREPAVLWTMNVAPTGALKTPTQKVLLKPLWELQAQANQEYEAKLQAWQAQKTHYEGQRKKGEECPELNPEPTPREYWVGDATMEALIKTHGENPRGFLKFHDEIDGFFRSFNKYRNGLGDDEQNWLALNDGSTAVKQNRVDRRRRVELSRTAVSMTGSIQPETLAKYLGTERDTTGMNARWIYCAAPMPVPQLMIQPVSVDVYGRLQDLYQKLANLPAAEAPVTNGGNPETGV
ncbi:MAG TPA: DUF3987 domain-containing protein, partial [Candidatus Caenarcaniphilales bacterium]